MVATEPPARIPKGREAARLVYRLRPLARRPQTNGNRGDVTAERTVEMRAEREGLDRYLEDTIVVDWQTPAVLEKARELCRSCESEEQRVRTLFEWVRDAISHSFDVETDVVTCSASQVLREGTGLCYAKSHLLAALLRARGIPAGFGYQLLRREPPAPGHVLHGFAAVWLCGPERWVPIDARGDKERVRTEFRIERPSFAHTPDPEQGEETIPVVFARPARSVVDLLSSADSLARVRNHLPGTL